MTRNVPALIFGALIALTLGIAGIALATHLAAYRWTAAPVSAAPPPPKVEPRAEDLDLPAFTAEEMDKLADKTTFSPEDIARLVACFKKDHHLSLQAEDLLKKAGIKAVPAVQRKLQDDDPLVRFCAAETLAWIGPQASGAAGDLAESLADDDDAKVRRKAAYALGQIKVSTDPVLDRLVKAIGDTDADVASTALEALEHIGPAAAPKLYRLVPGSKSPTRERVLTTLEKIGAPPKEALQTVAVLTQDPSPATRHQALRLLSQFGDAAAPVYAGLLPRIKREDQVVLLQCIGTLGPKAKGTLPALAAQVPQDLLRTKSPLDDDTLRIFKNCGPDGAKSLMMVLVGLEGKTVANPVRQSVLKGISQMGADAKVTVPLLVSLLESHAKDPPNAVRRTDILETLGDLGPAAKDAGPAVRALTKDPAVAAEANVALRRMGVIGKE